jgi:hypothetical protein
MIRKRPNRAAASPGAGSPAWPLGGSNASGSFRNKRRKITQPGVTGAPPHFPHTRNGPQEPRTCPLSGVRAAPRLLGCPDPSGRPLRASWRLLRRPCGRRTPSGGSHGSSVRRQAVFQWTWVSLRANTGPHGGLYAKGREDCFAGGAEAGAPGRPRGGRDEGRRRRARALGPAPRARFPSGGSEDKKRPAGRSRERGISLPAGRGEENLLPATWWCNGCGTFS